MASVLSRSPQQSGGAAAIQRALAVGYAGLVVICFAASFGPRFFWTMALPLLPITIVIIGFNAWRRICPLAYFADLGVRWRRRGRKVRRVPDWMERWFFPVAGGFLVAMLVVRLTLINGDGAWLGGTLLGLAVLAGAVNFAFPGKSWCNFLCPVGIVERIYTEPNSLRSSGNSQCGKCTACKKHCPDIDQENAYWKDVTSGGRKLAYYAFPGVVLAFYLYYWLRHGNWEAYFDGRWTRTPASLELAFGPGFFFLPGIPAVLAASLTMVALSAASYGLFCGLERLIGWQRSDPERTRHLTLTLAGFTAFNVFYVFAGAPSLRQVFGATTLTAFLVPVVAALFVAKRWQRSSSDYMKSRSARKLLSLWKFEPPPSQEPAEVFAFFQGRQQAHAAQLTAYREAAREILARGELSPGDSRLLAQLQRDLEISEAEHRALIAVLAEEESRRSDPADLERVEQRLQLQGYQEALNEALTRGASLQELDAVRIDYGVSEDVHRDVLEELHGDSGPRIARVERQLDGISRIRQQMAILISRPGTEFAIFTLRAAQERALRRIVDSLLWLGGAGLSETIGDDVLSPDPLARANGLHRLRAAAVPAALLAGLEPILQHRLPHPAPRDDTSFLATVKALAAHPDPFRRAGSAMLAAAARDDRLQPVIDGCLADATAFVREAAVAAALHGNYAIAAETLHALRHDADERVRRLVPERASLPEPGRLEASAGGPRVLPAEHAQRRFGGLTTAERILFLRQVPLFANLEPEDLHELSEMAQERVFARSEAFVRQGELTDDLYVVTAGQARIVMERTGRQEEVGRGSTGDVFGEMSMIDRDLRSATVCAESDSLAVLQINGEEFRRLLARRSDICMDLMKTMSRRLRDSQEARPARHAETA